MESEWFTALASVGALVLSAGLGGWSIRMTLQEKAAARAERISEGTRFYIDVKLISTREVSITLHNTSPHPIQNVIASAKPYDIVTGKGLPSKSGGLDPTLSINASFLPPRSARTSQKDIAALGYKGLYEVQPWMWSGQFHDHEGRAWMRHHSGRVERKSDFIKRAGSIEGPVTIGTDKNPTG